MKATILRKNGEKTRPEADPVKDALLAAYRLYKWDRTTRAAVRATLGAVR
jgi:hypothetical protein